MSVTCLNNCLLGFRARPRKTRKTLCFSDLELGFILDSVTDHFCASFVILPHIRSRSKDIVEPLIKLQWFMDCKDAARQAVDAVKTGKLKLIPEMHRKIW